MCGWGGEFFNRWYLVPHSSYAKTNKYVFSIYFMDVWIETVYFLLYKQALIGLLDYTTIFSALSNSSFIQYYDSNIGLFSSASYKLIALPTIVTAIVVALTRSYRR